MTISAYRVVYPAARQVELEEVKLRSPGPGQVLLRTEATLISTGTEITALSGDFPPNSAWSRYIQYPTGVGYSSVARVVDLGPEVTKLKPGDRVTGFGPHATHAIYAADRLHLVPNEVDSETATFATLAEIVMGGLRRGRVAFGEAIVIIGAGLVGQLAALFSRHAGGWPVVVLDPAESRLPTALRMGATHALPLTADAAASALLEITQGRMADVVLDVTGAPGAFVGALKLCRRQGRLVLLGSPRGPVTVDLHDELHSWSLEVIGAHNSGHPPVETPGNPWTIERHVRLFLDWLAAKVIDVHPLITHRVPWQGSPDAFRMLLEDRSKALGVVIDWSEEP